MQTKLDSKVIPGATVQLSKNPNKNGCICDAWYMVMKVRTRSGVDSELMSYNC